MKVNLGLTPSCITQERIKNKWVDTHVETSEFHVYKGLTEDFVNKKLNKAPYIKSIRRIPQYNGMDRIVVKYVYPTSTVVREFRKIYSIHS